MYACGAIYDLPKYQGKQSVPMHYINYNKTLTIQQDNIGCIDILI